MQPLTNQRERFHDDTRFLQRLTGGGIERRLTGVDLACRELPNERALRNSATDQEDTATAGDHGASDQGANVQPQLHL